MRPRIVIRFLFVAVKQEFQFIISHWFFLIQPINEKCLWNWIRDKSRQQFTTIGQWKRKFCLNSSTEKSVKVKTDFFKVREQVASSSYLAFIVMYIPLFWKPYTIVTKTNRLTLLMYNFLSRTTDVVNNF